MVIQTLEGTWEEIAKHADELKGRHLRVTVFDREGSPQPNEEALRIINRVAEKQKEMRFTSGEETPQILRNGEMFGNNSSN